MRTATIFYSDGCIHRYQVSGTNPEIRNKFSIGKRFYTDDQRLNVVSVKALTIE
ncbi:hypothetical protein SAMN04489761_4336 [Tenacibaculum sp. MAR_2009_124]|uniref:hypothetical protein n=1 Tax=Tenacibaculum sp. MAR_2009_124 TaxID=1250059 RepID=UPI00089C761E|nr:hypothetical protein [Tenacibaculum sp. MAR_2009_124]SED12072.1 hypothetical protein SAMN04489761_4336 [Tenacibaculum sp. MAR_2009_124]